MTPAHPAEVACPPPNKKLLISLFAVSFRDPPTATFHTRMRVKITFRWSSASLRAAREKGSHYKPPLGMTLKGCECRRGGRPRRPGCKCAGRKVLSPQPESLSASSLRMADVHRSAKQAHVERAARSGEMSHAFVTSRVGLVGGSARSLDMQLWSRGQARSARVGCQAYLASMCAGGLAPKGERHGPRSTDERQSADRSATWLEEHGIANQLRDARLVVSLVARRVDCR